MSGERERARLLGDRVQRERGFSFRGLVVFDLSIQTRALNLWAKT